MSANRKLTKQVRELRRLRKEDGARVDAARAEIRAWIEGKIGPTPRARLKWLLESFLRADLAKATEREWGEWRSLLDGFTRRGNLPWFAPRRTQAEEVIVTTEDRKTLRRLSRLSRALAFELKAGFVSSVRIRNVRWTASPEERAEIASCQKLLREVLEGLARGRLARTDLGGMKLIVRIGPEVIGTVGPQRLVRYFEGSLLARVLLAALDQLQEVGAERLRVCPFQEPGAVVVVTGQEGCGRLFLAAKGQRYCSRAHSAKASYLRWKERGFPRGGGKGRRGPKV